MMRAKNIGSSFDDFLRDEAMLDEATAVAVKRVIAWQIDQEMKSQNQRGQIRILRDESSAHDAGQGELGLCC